MITDSVGSLRLIRIKSDSKDIALFLGLILLILSTCFLLFDDRYSLLISCSSLLLCAVFLTMRSRLHIGIMAIVAITCSWALFDVALGNQPMAWLPNRNLVGYIAAIGFLIGLNKRDWSIILLTGITMAFVDSLGAWLCVIVPIGITYRKSLIALTFVAIGSAILIISNGWHTVIMRLEIWSSVHVAAIGESVTHIPYGLEHFHNAALQLLSGVGAIPSIVIIALAIGALWIMFRSGRFVQMSAAWMVLVSSIVDYIYWWPGIAAIVIAYVLWSIGWHDA